VLNTSGDAGETREMLWRPATSCS